MLAMFLKLSLHFFKVHSHEQNPPLPGLRGGILQSLLKLSGIEQFLHPK
jgi:hypothetical protein